MPSFEVLFLLILMLSTLLIYPSFKKGLNTKLGWWWLFLGGVGVVLLNTGYLLPAAIALAFMVKPGITLASGFLLLIFASALTGAAIGGCIRGVSGLASLRQACRMACYYGPLI